MFSPESALRRVAARRAIDQVRNLDGGKDNRNTARWKNRSTSGELKDWREVKNVRERAFDLYANNVYARKIIRACVAQTVGCGFKAESQAVNADDEPDDVFRKQAKRLWGYWCEDVDFNANLCLILQELLIAGEVLIHVKANGENIVPVDIDIVACEQLVEDTMVPSTLKGIDEGNYIYRGIEFNQAGERVAYHIYDVHPQDPRQILKTKYAKRLPAKEIIHLYKRERPGQIRGYSWFAPVIMQLRDINDYQQNELIAATVGSCVVAGITTSNGSSGLNGLQTPSVARSVDEDGNPITRMQPGMWVDLRPGEKIEGFNPQRPNSMASEFITHMLRGMAAGMPGIKSSTITMDYRESSWSSERSADNDCWRETEQVQEWLISKVCQPIYNRVIEAGVKAGQFDVMDFRGFSQSRFAMNRRRYLKCLWSGPVAKSINPRDDEEASKLAIEIGTSSLPVEAAARGLNWEEMLEDSARVAAKRKALGLPDTAQLEADVMTAQANPPQPAPQRYDYA